MQPQLFKQLGDYLGKKLDAVVLAIRNTPQKLEIDLGASSKELAEAAKALSDVSEAIARNEDARNLGPVIAQLRTVLSGIERQAKAVEGMASKIDTSAWKTTNDILSVLVSAVRENKPPVAPELDLSALDTVSTILLTIARELEAKNTSAVEGKLDRLISLFEKFKLETKDTLKLDTDQFKALITASGSGGGGTIGPRTTKVANVTMTTGGTEYSYTFPAGTVSFYMKLRAVDQQFQYAWTANASNTTYMTTTYNFLNSRENVEFGGKTIYFQCSANSQVMEIESYVL